MLVVDPARINAGSSQEGARTIDFEEHHTEMSGPDDDDNLNWDDNFVLDEYMQMLRGSGESGEPGPQTWSKKLQIFHF